MSAVPEDFSKAELLRRITESRERLEALIRPVPTAALERPGEDGWSAKDHLAHIAGWQRSLVALLDGRPRHTAIGVSKDEYEGAHDADALNAKLHESRAGWTLAQVLTDFQSIHEECMAMLGRMSEEDLLRGYSYYQPGDGEQDDRPVFGWIVGNTNEHFDEHREYIARLLERD